MVGENVLTSWRGISDVSVAKGLIDYGALIKWSEMRTLKRNFSDDDKVEIVKYFAHKLCERVDNRLSAEITVESLLIWLASINDEQLIDSFIDQIFDEPNRVEGSKIFVEIALTAELSEINHGEEIFAMAVMTSCELGLAIFNHDQKYPGEFTEEKSLLEHYRTYLLSVGNTSSSSIRLSLLHYFGSISQVTGDTAHFNRLVHRFGHTVLDNLFLLLFKKKSESVALQYLLDNLPNFFNGNSYTQEIIHETFKQQMLKYPERFALFLKSLSERLSEHSDFYSKQIKTFLQHEAALLALVSRVNHKVLAKEILMCMMHHQQHGYFAEVKNQIIHADSIRPEMKKLFEKLCSAATFKDMENTVSKFTNAKRGRRPSFAKSEYIGSVSQVTYLSSKENKAS